MGRSRFRCATAPSHTYLCEVSDIPGRKSVHYQSSSHNDLDQILFVSKTNALPAISHRPSPTVYAGFLGPASEHSSQHMVLLCTQVTATRFLLDYL